jgi:hypothetical protein
VWYTGLAIYLWILVIFTHPASCTMGTGGKSAAGAWRWPLTPI